MLIINQGPSNWWWKRPLIYYLLQILLTLETVWLLGATYLVCLSIVLSVIRRFLYWTNCDSKPSIERARLDGSRRQTLITEQLVEPNAIVVDQATDKIYWVDVWLGVQFEIESADMDGNNRKILYKGGILPTYSTTLTLCSVYFRLNIEMVLEKRN